MARASRKSRSVVIGSFSSTPRFCNSHSPSSSSSLAFAFCTSSFTSRSSTFFHPSSSLIRVNLYSSSIQFSLDRSISPNQFISVALWINASRHNSSSHHQWVQTCMCSPTTHPGFFHCSFHRRAARLHHTRCTTSACTNLRWQTRSWEFDIKGDVMKWAPTTLIRSSSHKHRRWGDFHYRWRRQ